MHDAGVTGTNPLRTLQQGLGAISFASPLDQAKQPAFVLAPQYPVAIANDAWQISDYPDITIRLIRDLMTRYSLDGGRLYTTGQSGGCMASIALNIKYPDLFAASLLVAGQWDPAQVAPMAKKKLWIIVSQDDPKAYPGMNAITEVLEKSGSKVARAVWDGRSDAAGFQTAFESMLEDGADNDVFYVAFRKGTVIPEGEDSGGGAGHVWTWRAQLASATQQVKGARGSTALQIHTRFCRARNYSRARTCMATYRSTRPKSALDACG
ncbi:hypothetical protein [Agrobacterium sp. OT33]|uniref:carboxylesterase family protein n=1 Tax=Agrobacterium sp. OT33 TaxID=2815338 RepID=UPI001A8DABAC|nr:hypothetical protein [Agrobacterium sp. OT33]MBO0128469.1 hypothetical protein [Agrobacterium sp. OT33]